jgi:uncharacterized integral membrane protein
MTVGHTAGESALEPDSAGRTTPESRSPQTTSIDEVAAHPSAQPVAPTRISASWTALVAAIFVLIALVLFISENTQRSTVNFVGFHGHAPTAVVLLIAAIGGASVVVIVGVARIIQLRKVARRSGAPR